MGASAFNDEPSGCADFDRARQLLADARDEEALDLFEIVAATADTPAVRASAAAFAAGILLSQGRPWEVEVWADTIRANDGSADLAALLEASARLQLEQLDEALALLETVGAPADPWFPCTETAARIVRAHARYLLGDTEQASRDVLAAHADDPCAPDVWDAIARLVAETGFDPAPLVERLPEDRVLEVLAALRTSAAEGVERIAEIIWERDPGDARVLALTPSFAARLPSVRCLQWSARLRAAGMGRLCPLLARAANVSVEPRERVRAAALAYASFGDKRGREAVENAVPALPDDELSDGLAEVWTLAPALADSVVVAAATNSRRSLIVATGLFEGGARDEAYAVLVHGLTMEDADNLTTEIVTELLPVPVLEGLAEIANARGEDDVAGILEAVAVVAASRE